MENYDLSRLGTIVSAAAPLGAELSEECARRLDCLLGQGYGLTETSPATHLIPRDPARVRPGAAGLLVPNTECKVIDITTGKAVGPKTDGEICIRGP